MGTLTCEFPRWRIVFRYGTKSVPWRTILCENVELGAHFKRLSLGNGDFLGAADRFGFHAATGAPSKTGRAAAQEGEICNAFRFSIWGTFSRVQSLPALSTG